VPPGSFARYTRGLTTIKTHGLPKPQVARLKENGKRGQLLVRPQIANIGTEARAFAGRRIATQASTATLRVPSGKSTKTRITDFD